MRDWVQKLSKNRITELIKYEENYLKSLEKRKQKYKRKAYKELMDKHINWGKKEIQTLKSELEECKNTTS